MDQLNKGSASQESMPHLGHSLRSRPNRTILIIIGVGVVLLATVWIWKSAQVSNVKKKAVADRESLTSQARLQIRETHSTHLRMLAKPLVWAIRSEMMQGNIGQVNLYANDLVKEKNIQRIVIADREGRVISSTNKKDEGKPFLSIGKPGYLTSDTTIVESSSDTTLVMSSPIMGFNNRLGTIMITYKAKSPAFR